MAFNPFHAFRKYRKQSFAVLTIVCMFVFVLSSGIGGGADFFDQITGMFGGGRAQGGEKMEVARLNGKSVTVMDLKRLRDQRDLANLYMTAAVTQAQQTVVAQLERDVARIGPGLQQMLQQAVRSKKESFNNPMAAFQFMQSVGQLRLFLNLPVGEGNEKDKEEAARLIGRLEDLAAQDARLLMASRGYYFGGNPSEESLLDFMVMQVHADRLGVKFTEADVKAAVDRETLRGLTREKAVEVENMVRRRHPNFSPDQLMAATAEEFRIRAVRSLFFDAAPRPLTEALEARTMFASFFQAAQPPTTPDANTPYALWDFFRQARTELHVAVLPVDVAAFLPKVTAEPTEDELRALFKLHQQVEPAPNQESPGFKQPRQVKVQFVSGKADLPYFRQSAAKAFAAVGSASLVGNALAVPFGGGFVPTAAQVGVPLGHNLRLKAEYVKWQAEQSQPWGSVTFGPFKLHDASVGRPEVAAAFAGQLLGAAGTHGALAFGPPAGLAHAALVAQVHDAGQRGNTAVLASLGSVVSPVGTASAVTLPRAVTPTPPPLDAVRARLEKRIADDQAKTFFIADLEQFRAEVEKRGKELVALAGDARKAKEAELEKFVRDEAAKRGLTVGGSTQPGTQFTLIDDPGLKPLRELITEGHAADNPLQTASMFSNFFFTGNPAADANAPPQGRNDQGNGGPVFLPRWYPGGTKPLAGTPLPTDRPTFLVWKTEDRDAQILSWRTPDEIAKVPDTARREQELKQMESLRAQVKAAWRQLKARDLAEQAARALADQAKALKGDLPALKDFAAKQQRTLFELGPVAQQLPVPQTTAGGPRQYEPFRVPQYLITFPSDDFVGRLLKLKDDAVGTTLVLHDQPKDHFFVASLTRKVEPTEVEFDRAFFQAGRGNTSQDTLFQPFEQQQQAAYKAMVMEQLRLDAGLQVNTENLARSRDRE